MLFFTILCDARQLSICSTTGKGELGEDQPPQNILFCSLEAIVAERDGTIRLYHVREIRSESAAAISGYCIEGEDMLAMSRSDAAYPYI